MKPYFVFHVPGFPHNHKVATIVAAPNNDTTYNFGLAIRSPVDNYNRKKGVAKALGRLTNTSYKNLTPNIASNQILSHITNVAIRHNFRETMDVTGLINYINYMQKFLENKSCNLPTLKKN